MLTHSLRVLICAAALWIVARGVTLHDRVVLMNGEVRSGTVHRVSESRVEFSTAAGERTTIPADAIGREQDGAFRVSYGLATAWKASHKGLLFLALLVHFPVAFPLALRFRWLLGAQGIYLGYWECLKLTFAGNFLNFATPLGSHAGDAFKAYFASLHTRRKTEAVTTVILDRAIGLATLLVVAAVLTLVAASAGKLAILRPYVLGLLAFVFVGAAIYFSPLLTTFTRRTHWAVRFPAWQHIQRFDAAARTLVRRWRILGGAVALTILLQWLALGAYFIVAVAMNLQADSRNIIEYYAYFYAGTLVQALPGPPQGLGTVELTYRYFFEPFGSPSQIVFMALAIRVVVLICALPGLLVTMTGGYRPKAIDELMAPADEGCDSASGRGTTSVPHSL